MAKINYNKFFENSDNKYYNSTKLIDILESILDRPIDEIKNDINNSKVSVTKEEIEEYLENKFIEEDPELKKRIESPRPKRSSNILKWTKQDIEDSSQEFVDDISAKRYHFEPYTLEYFNKYTTIVKNKANQLLEIIVSIANKDTKSINKVLTDLDIVLDNNGNILKDDIICLITPTVYNINCLNKKVIEANDLSTYLTFKMSKNSIYREGLFEGEIYPRKSIVTSSLQENGTLGSVCLSEKQKEKLHEESRKSMRAFAKKLLN